MQEGDAEHLNVNVYQAGGHYSPHIDAYGEKYSVS